MSVDGCTAEQPPPGSSGWCCVGARGGDAGDAAERYAVYGITCRCVDAASINPIREGGVPFCLESLSAQDPVYSGDEKLWSGLQASRIGDTLYDGVEVWLEGVE